MAGFDLQSAGGALEVTALDLTGQPPAGATVFTVVERGKGAEEEDEAPPAWGQAERVSVGGPLAEVLDAIGSAREGALVFDPPLEGVLAPGPDEEEDEGLSVQTIHWLPLLPARDRPPRRLADGSEEEHELTRALRDVVRGLRQASQTKADKDITGLKWSVRLYQQAAYEEAVGLRATGFGSSKHSFLRRGVLGGRHIPSLRLTAAPAGPLGLALDEVGLSRSLARVLLSEHLTGAPPVLWLKRDPVLHRWGMVPVRVRLLDEEQAVLRLPASLLGPLGADFDGDTVVLFAGVPASGPEGGTPALAWHPLLRQPMYVPGKQYAFGLERLRHDPARLADLRLDLHKEGFGRGPVEDAWPAGPVPDAWRLWTQQAVSQGPHGEWWAILERHALAALAEDPGMGLGLLGADELAELPAVRCGAAKNLYEEGAPRQASERILAGRALEVYQGAEGEDPIAAVMVAARASVGRFGGALRRILHTADPLTPEVVAAAQALTEKVTQQALSVKAGRAPLRYADFEVQLRLLLEGKPWSADIPKDLQGVLAPLSAVWWQLQAAMPGAEAASARSAFLEWLRKPHELASLVRQRLAALHRAAAEQLCEPHELAALIRRYGVLRLPASDLRALPWFRP